MDEKFLSPEDFVSISTLIGAYQHYVDAGDEESWVALFTEDGTFERNREVVGAPRSCIGHEGLKQIPRIAKTMFGGKSRHHVGSVFIEYGETKDQAVARYYVLLTTWLEHEEPNLYGFSDMQMHLVRLDGKWRIKSNFNTFL